MLDVVPPAEPKSPSLSRRGNFPPRRLARVPAVAPPARPRAAAPRVVSLQWRLPARLRRPIRQELARARRQAKREQSIVTFARRALYSDVPDDYPRYGRPPGQAINVGAEHHTADVYLQSRPTVTVAAPPYRGRGATLSPAPRPAVAPPALNPKQKLSAPRVAPAPRWGDSVRDVPYRWPQSLRTPAPGRALFMNEAKNLLAPVQKPKRRFTLPLHFSVFPWRRKDAAHEKQPKKKR